MTQFQKLKSHLENDERVEQLREIEQKLVEHKFPPQLVIETTSYCNYKCIHCSHREMIRPQQHMDREVYNKIVEEVGKKSPNCEIWPTFYGEAFILGDELWDMLDYADKVGCKNLVLKRNKKINVDSFKNELYTKNIPDPEILIRTGGTKRLSNFLLWQLAYAEIFFVDKLWPDFKEDDFNKIVNKYYNIKRNFGTI